VYEFDGWEVDLARALNWRDGGSPRSAGEAARSAIFAVLVASSGRGKTRHKEHELMGALPLGGLGVLVQDNSRSRSNIWRRRQRRLGPESRNTENVVGRGLSWWGDLEGFQRESKGRRSVVCLLSDGRNPVAGPFVI